MKRILIIRLSSIGDIVMALPVAETLKDFYETDCEITWLTRDCFQDLVNDNRFIDNVVTIESLKGFYFKMIKEIFRTYNKKTDKENYMLINTWKLFLRQFPVNKILKNNKYDIIIDLQGNIESILVGLSANCKIIMPSFVDNGVERFAVHNAKNKNIVHRIDEYLDTLKLLGCERKNRVFNYGWSIDKNSIVAQKNKYGIENTKYAVIALATQWESKNYPTENWAKIIKYINEKNLKVIIVGSSNDKKYIKELNKYIDKNKYVDLIGKTTLKELINIIKNAKLLLSGDTGAMHIADSLNTPLLTFMGPTDPKVWGPYNQTNNFISVDYECKNCYKNKCPLNRICLEDISFDTIKKNIDRILDEDIEK